MWQYLVIILILIVIAFAILKAKNKDFKLEANKLIEYLGGSANIVSYEDNKSRFVVELHNIELVNKEAIQKMGAQGIVEIDNQLKIIFGEDARQLRKYIDELLGAGCEPTKKTERKVYSYRQGARTVGIHV